MAKLKLNKNLNETLDKEIMCRGLSLALSGVIAISGLGIVANNNLKKHLNAKEETNKTSITYLSSNKIDSRDLELKKHIQENISNLEVVVDEDAFSYYITETIYKKVPVYDTNGYGNTYITEYKKEPSDYRQYSITFEKAKELNIEELLQTRIVYIENTNIKIR